MNRRERILGVALSVTMLIIAVMVLLPLMHIQWAPARYIFAVAAVAVLVIRLLERHKSDVVRIKRLHRMEKVAAICFMLSAFFMFYPEATKTDWLGFLMAGAVLQVYTAFMIAHEEKKKAKKDNNN